MSACVSNVAKMAGMWAVLVLLEKHTTLLPGGTGLVCSTIAGKLSNRYNSFQGM
jgi:hypothetical protein